MTTDQYGQMILSETDLIDLVMRNRELADLKSILVEPGVSVERAVNYLDRVPELVAYNTAQDLSVAEFDRQQQSHWHMPEEYKNLDIAELVLSLCKTQEQLQRVGQELLLYQERDLFDLLRFLKYLVDVVEQNQVVLGVGRGSSVASYVLYLLGVHKIDSMYYDLDITEFLR